jgi:ribonuclease BN (tRNA processing enzyme)
MLKIKFLGTGSAFTLKNFQTNALVTLDNGYRLLVDCGSYAPLACDRAGLTYLDIDGVYVSHLHADHIGGLEWLAFANHFDPRRKTKPDLWISRGLVDDLWSRSLSGGLASLQNETNTLESYFNVRVVEKNEGFTIGGVFFNLIHVRSGFNIEPSFGLMVGTMQGTRVFLTTDSQHCPNDILDFYKSANAIFHDCECTPFRSGVHAHFDELATLPEDIRAKIQLVHYQDVVLADWDAWEVKAKAAGFVGFVRAGVEQEF